MMKKKKVKRALKHDPDWQTLANYILPDVYAETVYSFAERPSTYNFFMHLTIDCWQMHAQQSEDKLKKIYAFLYWAFDHPSEELWNPAGVSFLEHLFEPCKSSQEASSVLEWLRPDMTQAALKLMKFIGQPAQQIAWVEQAFRGRHKSRVREVHETLENALEQLERVGLSKS